MDARTEEHRRMLAVFRGVIIGDERTYTFLTAKGINITGIVHPHAQCLYCAEPMADPPGRAAPWNWMCRCGRAYVIVSVRPLRSFMPAVLA